MSSLEERIKFILEIDKMKQIIRQTYIADGSRKENDAEHSWHMAMMCMVLSDYSNEKIDILKAIKMALVHDLVEIDAGDTYAFDPEGAKTKKKREEQAAVRLFALLDPDMAEELRALWEEFEEMGTPESRFVNTLDKIQPLLLNDATDGKSWREHGITVTQVMERNCHTGQGSEVLWDYGKGLIEQNYRKGNLTES